MTNQAPHPMSHEPSATAPGHDSPAAGVAARNAERAIRVLAVDDDPMVLDLIRVMLKAAPDIELVATACDGDEVVGVVTAHHPDVVLMDVRMQRVGGIDATRALTKRPNAPRVVILTTFDEQEYVPQAMDAGAVGFILKATASRALYDAIRDAHAGRTPMSPQSAGHLRAGYLDAGGEARREARRMLSLLTEREYDVACLVAQERTNPEIAAALIISASTAKQHVSAIQRKLGVETRTGIAMVLARAE